MREKVYDKIVMEVSYEWVRRNVPENEVERNLEIVKKDPCHIGKEASWTFDMAREFTYGEIEFQTFAEIF